MTEKGIFFVTRLKPNAKLLEIECRTVLTKKELTSVKLSNSLVFRRQIDPPFSTPHWLPRSRDRQPHVFLTNYFKLAAKTLADIYKARWQVELFFKGIMQYLKIQTFIGTRKNADMIQIWIALCVYLLLAFIKFQSRLKKSMKQILRLLKLNLFEKRDLTALLRCNPIHDEKLPINQLNLL